MTEDQRQVMNREAAVKYPREENIPFHIQRRVIEKMIDMGISMGAKKKKKLIQYRSSSSDIDFKEEEFVLLNKRKKDQSQEKIIEHKAPRKNPLKLDPESKQAIRFQKWQEKLKEKF